MSGYVATIGFFDGVHLGHRHIINDVLKISRATGLQSMAITFSQHPRKVLKADYIPQLLTTTDEKLRLLNEAGISRTEVLDFDVNMASMSAREFMRDVLKRQLNVEILVVGYDNRFGHDRKEGFEEYATYGKECGIEVVKSTEITSNDLHISSSVIRTMIANGEIRQANACLGYEYSVSSTVIQGTHTGHRIGFPTANISPVAIGKLIPAEGVYAVIATTEDGVESMAMTNIGKRPTFNGENTTLETNIFGFDGNLYGKMLTIRFIDRIRKEKRFNDAEQLKRQLKSDRETAIEILKSRKI